MKIAMVFDQFLYGGIERVGTFYIQLLQKAGHSVDVYILNRQIEDFIQQIPDGCTVTKRPYDLCCCPEGTWPLAMQGDRAGLEMGFFAVKYMGRQLLHWVTKPHFTVKHEPYDLAIAFAGHIRDLTFVSSGCIPAKHTLAWLHGAQYQYALMSPGFYRLYKKIGNLVCLSELCDSECVKFNQKNHICKRKIFNPCALTKAPVDEEKVAALRETYGDFCVMVARLAQDKDQETVLYAMAYLKNELHLTKKLLLVGDGPKRPALERLAADLGLTHEVIFVGTRADVQNYYAAAYAYVHAALLEGLPTVFLEAMSYGLPVVTTDAIPGAGEILQQGEIGLISPNKAPQVLAKNIARLYNDTVLRQTLIERGTRRIADFHPDVIGAQLNDYLRQIVEG